MLTYPQKARQPWKQNTTPAMMCLLKSKPRTPVEVVRQTHGLLVYLDSAATNANHLPSPKRDNKQCLELCRSIRWVLFDRYQETTAILDEVELLCKLLREMKIILYGSFDAEPNAEACTQLTQEFFKENTFHLLVTCLPKLNLEGRKDATYVVANLQRQQVRFHLIACDYLEANLYLMDILVSGYDDHDIALHYGNMLRDCIRHQSVASYVLENHLRKLFGYIMLKNFDISSDASATFKELMTRHKSTVADFLSRNYDWFFEEFNAKLLRSPDYFTRRQSVKLLFDILADRYNAGTMVRYVSSMDNLFILMDLLRDLSKPIQVEAFHVFKLFVMNQNKPPEITAILISNRSKLLRYLASFSPDKEDEKFEADKARVEREIASLEPGD